MCILLYVKLAWCSSIPYIYGQLAGGALLHVHSAISETFRCSSIPYMPPVYVHSAKCETYLV